MKEYLSHLDGPAEPVGLAMDADGNSMKEPFYYTDLGNHSAVEPWARVSLHCDACRVEWLGCMDAAGCPKCGNHDSWDKLMEARGYYKPE